MKNPNVLTLTPSEASRPWRVEKRLGAAAPTRLWAIGDSGILTERKIALFCSVRCPGDAILRAYDTARKLRDEGVTVVSGFHSPVEKECLRILFRGKQPIIIGLARAMDKMRLPKEWRGPLEAGRLLILSPFAKRPRRPDRRSARRRNELVAALADEILIVHAEPGGAIEHIADLANRWSLPTAKLPHVN
jgi:predicted Rossmann fold nucleotide-binding protein DprA/Smf involved in DNA uptake